ncbi:MAG: phosphopyruvate hydratase [Candidatus Woesearchaeota archaeon]|jgi:enolase|nr:phosphopyruvate hydratase [Candidatus Woesearchaeota archaeon]MDP7506456.1 phosphopyruvate hydratase [Candidatus Woesearchaeota archaeon]MDP7610398.1 phosphopyruvate hydratase [Candidatus Woesearchaeota archaeon]|tara:strand:+ start:2017 stop:3255 length:1239 start_codon:yes stop_codon:yes gene_type:complete
MYSKITRIKAREILDSRGNPTVEVDVYSKNKRGREEVPSGASTGIHEALELRDKTKRYLGKGVLKAVNNVNKKIAPRLRNKNCGNQKLIDELMLKLDGTSNKKKLGANAILGVSLAACRLASKTQRTPLYKYIGALFQNKKFILPTPYMNIINGGKHADNRLQFQEFMIVPKFKTFRESLRAGSETYHTLKKLIGKKYGKSSTNVGDEGGFAPNLNKVREPLKLITKAIDEIGYGKRIKIAIDAAASEFYSRKGYLVDDKYLSQNKLLKVYESLVDEFPIISLEDPFSQDDTEGFVAITENLGRKVQIVGDDSLVTNVERIKKAVETKACNALLLKVNQIGTLTEALDAAKLAMDNNWNVMVSHRSGETSDSFIADLAVGISCGQIKAGAPCRSDRLAKYNQLLRIEEELGR